MNATTLPAAPALPAASALPAAPAIAAPGVQPAALPSRFQEVLLLVGQLNYAWTNTESLLIHLIAGLAKVDKQTAIVIFLTLNTGKARIELVERLAKMKRVDTQCRDAVLAVTEQMTRRSRLRNKFSHCIYSFDETGSRATTQLMRIVDGKRTIEYGKTEELGARELKAVAEAIEDIGRINRALWALVERYDFPR